MLPGIRVLKLITGEEIIGVLYDGADETIQEDERCYEHLYFVRGAMKVNYDYDENRRSNVIYLTDWVLAIADDVLPIEKDKVVTFGVATEDLENYYCDLMLVSMDNKMTEEEKKAKSYQKMLKKHKFDDDDMQ
jgi:hypothetical protein